MQDILKMACPRFEFILLKAKVDKGICTLVNMFLHSLSNSSRKKHFNEL
jgi:hypothetical protein